MNKAKKWNFKTREYEDYTLPQGVVLMSYDMDRIIPCACCGKGVVFGVTYTSRAIHTDMGLGYPVCEECYDNECMEKENVDK